ncbi:hypothetical protein A2U01_0050820, partial [Trifolium medium]|nr:hypothetical protein [Trifolium medium]
MIDDMFGFRRADYCWASQQRASAHTDEEYADMLQTLALPGRDWPYTATGTHFRFQITDMTHAAKGWAKWLVHNFESCSNETEIIMSRCHVIYSIMRGEPIQVGKMIARTIKRMITRPDAYICHPFVITALCRLQDVP